MEKIVENKLKKLIKYAVAAVALVTAAWGINALLASRQLFDDPYSTTMYSADGRLLGARIAADGQWRFPAPDSLPDKFVTCLLTYEDKRFYRHRGVDPMSIGRAVVQNIRSRKVVSGGSTLTMQLARIARGNRDRNIRQKLIETYKATVIERTHTKQQILQLYAAHAPFGGNVVGLEAAAWRYFGRSPFDLSWAESATLAVLPNSPALIHPGRNRDLLEAKRNRLLGDLREKGIIDEIEYDLACLEPLPDAPMPLPDIAPHLLERLAAGRRGERIGSSLDYYLQQRVQHTVDRYAREYASNHIYNMAAIVADVNTGEVIAYAGNVSFKGDDSHGNSVDVITAERSTGSLLKPILYAGMLNDGMILPTTLIPDVPLNINGFMPQNFTKTFYGAVPARRAIERSLNVPLVRMLAQYNTGRFMNLLRSCGMTTLHFSETHYGVSLILGGAEGTLWDMAGMYASLARTMKHYRQYNGRYDRSDIHPLTAYPAEKREPITSVSDRRLSDKSTLSYSSLWLMFEAMSGLNRPEEEADWQQFESMKKVAWKTGTSYGGRDAWAIGVTPRYVVGVWVGNASGEGRAGLTGVGNAAPALFDIFSMLSGSGWFDSPLDDMVKVPVCRRGGHRASDICDLVDSLYIPLAGMDAPVCPYHRVVHLSRDGRWRVNSSCEDVSNIITRPWFVLPPSQELYFRNYNPDYVTLPPIKPGCGDSHAHHIDILYPEHNAVLYLPKGFSGDRERFVFRAAHATRNTVIYWFVDDEYVGETRGDHQISTVVSPGRHILTLTDSNGNQRRISFEIRE